MLAWTRTALSAGVCALLLVRLAAGSSPRVAVAAALGVPVVLAVATAAGRRSRRLRAGPVGAAPAPTLVAAAGAVLLGVAAAGLVLARLL